MAGPATIPYTIKCELLKSIIEKIQCQKCKSVPGLVEDQQNCYVCKKGHSLCINYRDKICPPPCGSTAQTLQFSIYWKIRFLQILKIMKNTWEVNCPTFFCQSQMFVKEHLYDFIKSTENKFDITYGHFFDSDD